MISTVKFSLWWLIRILTFATVAFHVFFKYEDPFLSLIVGTVGQAVYIYSKWRNQKYKKRKKKSFTKDGNVCKHIWVRYSNTNTVGIWMKDIKALSVTVPRASQRKTWLYKRDQSKLMFKDIHFRVETKRCSITKVLISFAIKNVISCKLFSAEKLLTESSIKL